VAMNCPNARSFAGIAIAALLFCAGAAFAAPPQRVAANDLAFERSAKAVAKGQKLVVEGLLLEKELSTAVLELERFEVWRPDAVVLVDGARVAPPKSVYFRGKVAGEPDSAVLLSVREKGGVMGMVFRGDSSWAIGKGKGAGALRSQKSRPDELKKPFECGLDAMLAPSAKLGVEESAPASAATVPDEVYDAIVAVETDYEYYALFGNTTDALDYMGDLFGYADLVYSREIDTDMFIGFSRLWTGGAGSDPWSATTSSNALTEFRAYWNANMTATKRTTAHMLSGKSTGGGVAWVGVLCDNYASPGSSYDYGYSGALGGSFNWDGNQAHNPASVVWDIMVVQHEIGHNFNSPHTHDYCNVGGSSQPIDRCYQGCAGAGQGLPSCSGPTPFFNGGKGTIMSYCHLLSGGYNNQAMTFGEGHT
ncbi:MAG: M12 family metallo-peptidase, partial [Myxococcota bacterium]